MISVMIGDGPGFTTIPHSLNVRLKGVRLETQFSVQNNFCIQSAILAVKDNLFDIKNIYPGTISDQFDGVNRAEDRYLDVLPRYTSEERGASGGVNDFRLKSMEFLQSV